MMSSISHIKNPLTIVGVFAGIVEISANLILPFLTDKNQSIYIWFLMMFPAGLVLIFFSILNWNHGVLYAPSDFSNENNFVTVLASKAVPFGNSVYQGDAEVSVSGWGHNE